MKYKLLVLIFLCMSGCSRTELPTACKSLQPFVRSQKQQIKSMLDILNQQGKNGFPQINEKAAKLYQEQESIYDSCAAPMIARGPDCLEFHLISDVSAAQRNISGVKDLSARDSALPREDLMKTLLNRTLEISGRSYEQRACIQNL